MTDRTAWCRTERICIYLCLMTGKEKGKGKRHDSWRYNNGWRPCVCVYYMLLTFFEVEHMRQVHPWQTMMTSEEVPLLWALKFSLSARILQETMSTRSQLCVCGCVCAVVSVYVLLLTALCWEGNVICALVTAFSVNVLKRRESPNSPWHESCSS